MRLVTLLFLLFTNISYADMSNQFKLTELSMEIEKAVMSNRTFFTPDDEQVNGYFNLNMNFDVNKYGYFHNEIISEYSNRQFRSIAWSPEVGFKLFSNAFNIYYRHYSGHSIDRFIGRRFPEQNAVGLRLNFIKK